LCEDSASFGDGMANSAERANRLGQWKGVTEVNSDLVTGKYFVQYEIKLGLLQMNKKVSQPGNILYAILCYMFRI